MHTSSRPAGQLLNQQPCLPPRCFSVTWAHPGRRTPPAWLTHTSVDTSGVSCAAQPARFTAVAASSISTVIPVGSHPPAQSPWHGLCLSTMLGIGLPKLGLEMTFVIYIWILFNLIKLKFYQIYLRSRMHTKQVFLENIVVPRSSDMNQCVDAILQCKEHLEDVSLLLLF